MRCAFCLFLVALVSAFALAAPAAAREARGISYAAVSADGVTVYFTCWGDIWSAPRDASAPARRLTDNVAYDSRPIPSPDGSQLLFMSDRFGSSDLFVMPAQGGPAARVSWGLQTDYPYAWSRDGASVLEYAVRQDLWGNALYEVPLDGSQPRRVTGPDQHDNVFGNYLGGGGRFVFARGAGDWTRKNYVGSASYDLYSFDSADGSYTQLTREPGNEMWPQPSPNGQVVYFVSDRDGTYNLWALDVASGAQRQLTHFKGDGPRWPRISSDGDEIAFEVFGELNVLRLPDGAPEKVALSFDGDYKHEMQLSQDIPDNAGEYVLAPNGKYFAVTVMGDLFVLKNPDSYPEDAKPDQDLSRAFAACASPGREMQPAWSPDSTRLVYLSDRDGQFDVFLLDLQTKEERRITDTPADEWVPSFSPASRRDAEQQYLLYYSGNRRLVLHDLKAGTDLTLRDGTLRDGPWALGYDWAPDGRWVAFVEEAELSYADIFVIGLNDDGSLGEPVNITFTPDWEDGPMWSKDSKWLAFTCYGDSGSDVKLLELNPEKDSYDTQLLFPDDMPRPEGAPEPDEKAGAGEAADTDAEQDNPADAAQPDENSAKEAEAEEKQPVPVVIDFTRINLRAEAISKMEGSAYSPLFDPQGKFVIFVSNSGGEDELWSMTLDDERTYASLGPLAGRTSPQFAPDTSRLYYLENSGIGYAELSGPSIAGGGAVGLTSHVAYDQYTIWEQMLAEGWRHLRDGFYDPAMHGVDWNEVLARYLPRVRECGCQEDFTQLMRDMLGELGGSHLGFYGERRSREAPPENVADFGVYFDEGYDGPGWKVRQVLANGPADQPASRLYAGDVITKLNGREIAAGANRERLLTGLAGQPQILSVLRDADVANTAHLADVLARELPRAGERVVTIMPADQGALAQLRYEQWVEDNRQAVYAMSDKRIGYQHIQEMELESFDKFRRELFSESRDKQALIIDVRFNGGGWTHEQLLSLLDRKVFAYTQMRDAPRQRAPLLKWDGPIVVLTNPSSYSDAEIFPHIMKELGLATIIGEPTGGNVIGTWDFQLLDGSGFRLPSEGWWLLDDTNMEGNGAQPDILVPFDAAAYGTGHDNQLEAAVEYLKGRIAP